MEDILLCNAGISAEGCGVELAVKVGVDGSLHPYIDRKSLEIAEAKEGTAGGDLVTDTAYRFKTFDSMSIASRGSYHIKPYLAFRDLFCRIEYVRIAEAGVRGEKPLRPFEYLLSSREGVTNAAILAFFLTRGRITWVERAFVRLTAL